MDSIHRIKICGLSRKEDVILAAKLGAWALGFIFYKKSPRAISMEQAKGLIDSLSEIKTDAKPKHLVGVFVNAPIDDIVNTCQIAGINTVQLHGDEDPDYLDRLKERVDVPIIKVFRPKSEEDLRNIHAYNKADFFLIDAAVQGAYGGTGSLGNWKLVSILKSQKPSILAGGINPDNIMEAFIKTKPFACDLSSSIEISPGVKNHKKMQTLFRAISV